MNHELLVPAGDMECLYQAVYNGADAVYISGMNFGARKFATNFTKEELVEAIKFCHLYGVRLYVTMNTLIKNNEVDEFLEQARFLHKNGVDALIVQDFGMICLLREKFPNLEIHASTQANNSSKDTCKLFYDLGVKRVVFSRELSIDEIDNIDVPIEKEAFIHGALCVSYSGCCLMSSMLGGRSGNRGECAGCCRMPFTLLEDDTVVSSNKYLLSMKELNLSPMIDRLIESTIYSFKIEGRMKSPLYVGFITRLYRNLIDRKPIDLDKETNDLKTIFNREFTLGNMFGITGKNLINSNSPNHIGLEIGSSTINNDKIQIKINSGERINQFDALRFLNSKKGMIINYLYDKNMKLCSSATDMCYVDNKVGLTKSDTVMKTHSIELENEFKDSSNKRKIDVVFSVSAKIGEKLKITINDGENEIVEYGNIVEKSINAPTSKDTFIKHLGKLGDTIFNAKDIILDLDNNIFVQIRNINDIRRVIINRLIDKRQENNIVFVEKDFSFDNSVMNNNNKKIICSVCNKEQLEECLENNVDIIYVKDKNLYDEYKDIHKNIYLFLDRCLYDYSKYKSERIVSSDIFDFNNYDVYGNYSLNITNIYTAYFLRRMGLHNIPLSVELSQKEVNDFTKLYNDKIGNSEFDLLVYGRVENMIIKGNVLDIDTDINNYYICDTKMRKFPVFYDGVNTHILNYDERLIDDVGLYNKRIDFYDESKSKVKSILEKFM